MDAKICDRCGEFYKPDGAIPFLKICARAGTFWATQDLCPSCFSYFIDFFGNKERIPVRKYDIECAVMSGFIETGNGTNDEIVSPVMHAVDGVFESAGYSEANETKVLSSNF